METSYMVKFNVFLQKFWWKLKNKTSYMGKLYALCNKELISETMKILFVSAENWKES
jgi:hypothetical protein